MGDSAIFLKLQRIDLAIKVISNENYIFIREISCFIGLIVRLADMRTLYRTVFYFDCFLRCHDCVYKVCIGFYIYWYE